MNLFKLPNDVKRKEKSADWKWTFADYPKEKNGLKVFSCFACGGGSTMGYKLAGCDVIGDLELDPRMNEIYVKNHHPKYNYCMDIRDFNKLPNDELPKELFDLDVLDASPPCSVFSTAGDRETAWGKMKKFREGQKEQTLDDLFFVTIETINKLRPKVAIMENVEGLLLGNAKKYVTDIYMRLKSIGYRVNHWLLYAEKMGVPQTRHRVFFIALRDDIDFDLYSLNMEFDYLPILFRDVKSDKIAPVSDVTRHLLLNAIPNSDTSLACILRRLEYRNSRFNEVIVWDDQIAPTIKPTGTYRGNDISKFTPEDYIHCSTFPEDYNYDGQSIGYICGMSVPPVMIKRIMQRLIESGLFNYKL